MDLIRARKILTMNGSRPVADAVVVDNGLVVFAGSGADAERLYGNRPDCRRIDLGSSVVVPGFNDNHLHAMSMGQFFTSPRVAGMSEHEIIRYLSDVWKDSHPGEALFARGWDYPYCPNPTIEALDRAFPQNPVVLIQYSGHGAWLNTLALREFGIDHRTPNPPGGRIERDAAGQPTGILTDDAVRPIHQKRFRRSLANLESAGPHLEEALRRFAEFGITSVQDNTWLPRAVGYYRAFRKSGTLTARISCWSYGEVWYGNALFGFNRFDDEWIARGPVKLFLDGTFSTRTAWMVDPYESANGEVEDFGTATHPQEWLNSTVHQYSRRGRQVAAHAIGDGAVRSFADAVEAANRRNPNIRNLRYRVEHAQLVHPEDIGRLANLGVYVAAQPHAAFDPEKDRRIIGNERFARAYPYRSLLDAGVNLSFGSDVPGEEGYNPLEGIALAVHRDGPQAITATEALMAYTVGSARAEFAERRKGTLMPGMVADMAVLDEDPTSVSADRISAIKVVKTIVGGRLVYDARVGYIPEARAIPESSVGDQSIPSPAGGS